MEVVVGLTMPATIPSVVVVVVLAIVAVKVEEMNAEPNTWRLIAQEWSGGDKWNHECQEV